MPPLPTPTFPPSTPLLPPATPSMPHSVSAPSLSPSATAAVTAHWFYRTAAATETWKPFSVEDSTVIETAYERGAAGPIAVEGTRWDVQVAARVKRPVYWVGEEQEVRRCTWFHRTSTEARWLPYEEAAAGRLEQEYLRACRSGQWGVKLVFESGDWAMLHSPEVIMHFPIQAALAGALDDWGQVQVQDPQASPRVVHRGLEGLPDIPDGEPQEVDHICFVVHGIGAACDIKFRPIAEVVDGFRELAEDIAGKHFAGARLASQANRVEFLPVNWHDKLHGEDTGTDARIQPLTLRSIPKMRSFVNDTLLDVLFYTSPLYCQTILDTVCSEINRLHELFLARNPGFQGQASVIGHSLGSLILFDLLAGQTEEQEEAALPSPVVKPKWAKDLGIEDVFAKLGISEHLGPFTEQGVGVEELLTCSEEDLKEAQLPLGPRKKLLAYLEWRREAEASSFQEFRQSSVVNKVSYCVGPAGTGQPSVRYPRLNLRPAAFFALGSPIGMFLAVRGIQGLGADFCLPTCPTFLNIFHPFDPVAYRIESLVDERCASLRPVLIPHHQGRKRMHLELKETMTRVGGDIKAKVMESLKATMGAVYSVAGTLTGQEAAGVQEQAKVQEERSVSPEGSEVEDTTALEASRINQGRRVDHVLQEAPMESFNEYVFALASHLCYWDSEDTVLLVLRQIYSSLGVHSDDVLGALAAPPPTSQPLHKSTSFSTFPPGPPSNLPPSFPPTGPPSFPPTGPPNTFSSLGISLPPAPSPYIPSLPPSVAPTPRGYDPTLPMEQRGPLAPPPMGGFTR